MENSTSFCKLWVSKRKRFALLTFNNALECILTYNNTLVYGTGVNFVTRKVAVNTSPTIEISLKDDNETFVVKTLSTFKNSQIEFQLGKEFEENRMDGKKVRTVINRDGNKLVQTQWGDNEVTIVREFTGDKLVTVCTCNDAVCTREYKKV